MLHLSSIRSDRTPRPSSTIIGVKVRTKQAQLEKARAKAPANDPEFLLAEFTTGKTFDDYNHNAMLRAAVEREFQIIDFPVNGTVVSLAGADKRDASIALKAEGGRAPFTWLINGAVLGSFDLYQETGLVPDGEGFARITEIDADGRSATSRVRFKKPE